MSNARHARELSEIAKDLDLAVYRLERGAPQDAEATKRERFLLRRELDQLRMRVEDVARALG
jgi:hypothetical protein